jgi:hypothetical protein
MINNLQNLSEDNINTIPMQEKKPIIFKLESSTFGSIDSSAKVQEKLLKNRQSAKKCRLKKKAYIKALEKKVKLLKSELEENNEDRNGPNYSIKTLLIQTLPKKLEFLSNILYNNEQLNLQSSQNINEFIDLIENNKDDIIAKSSKYLEQKQMVLLQIYLEEIKVLLRSFASFFDETDKLFLMNNNEFLELSD